MSTSSPHFRAYVHCQWYIAIHWPSLLSNNDSRYQKKRLALFEGEILGFKEGCIKQCKLFYSILFLSIQKCFLLN